MNGSNESKYTSLDDGAASYYQRLNFLRSLGRWDFYQPMFRKIGKFGLIFVYTVCLTWILLFLAIEIRPELLTHINLDSIPYYALKKASANYVSDSDLVLVYRKADFVFEAQFVGDIYKPEYGAQPGPIKYFATYQNGFRKNSSAPPYDVAVIGDSYIEIGESDDVTFAELLKAETGLSVLNLGRGWYGPPQYLEVLKRYATKVKPKYVLLCFFAGNDFEDIRQYKRWKNEGRYYFYRDLENRHIVSRFGIATKETAFRLGSLANRSARSVARSMRDLLTGQAGAAPARTELGLIEVDGKTVPKVFNYWERTLTTDEIDSFRSIISDFKAHCIANQIEPAIVYIPSSSQVYADSYSKESSDEFKKRMESARSNHSMDAVLRIAQEFDIKVVNLLPIFKNETKSGKLLYYRFDTHWNVEGRRTAASTVGSFLRDL